MLDEQVLFQSGTLGYHTFRIPALLTSNSGRVLAFAEGRVHGPGDAGTIELILRHSDDHGASWSDLQVVVKEDDMTCGNPCPVQDGATGTIWLWFCKNTAEGGEGLIVQGKAKRTVWLTHSQDDGETWSEPVDMTDKVMQPDWTWYATGPGHGIQLQSGRMVVPCDHMVGVHLDRTRDPYHSHVVYSDDGGATWHIGGIVRNGTNECEVVELLNGDVMINCRNYAQRSQRAVAVSRDQGSSFGEFRWDGTLVEPVCQASIVRWPQADNGLLFANPASATDRTRMMIRHSTDEGHSWPCAKLLHAGPAAYSDLAVSGAGDALCLYERGNDWPYETLTLARFDTAWLSAA